MVDGWASHCVGNLEAGESKPQLGLLLNINESSWSDMPYTMVKHPNKTLNL